MNQRFTFTLRSYSNAQRLFFPSLFTLHSNDCFLFNFPFLILFAFLSKIFRAYCKKIVDKISFLCYIYLVDLHGGKIWLIKKNVSVAELVLQSVQLAPSVLIATERLLSTRQNVSTAEHARQVAQSALSN